MIEGIQPGDVVIAEQMDRLSRGPLAEAEQLVATIRSKRARLAVPGVADFSDLSDSTTGAAKVILEQMKERLLKVTLQLARDAFKPAMPNPAINTDCSPATPDAE